MRRKPCVSICNLCNPILPNAGCLMSNPQCLPRSKTMNVPSLLRQFERIGAEIEVDSIAPGAVRDAGTPARRLALNEGYGLDVIQERRNERYSLIVRADLTET